MSIPISTIEDKTYENSLQMMSSQLKRQPNIQFFPHPKAKAPKNIYSSCQNVCVEVNQAARKHSIDLEKLE